MSELLKLFGGHEPFFVEFGFEPAPWDERIHEEAIAFYDIQPCALIVDENDRVLSDRDLVVSGNRESPDGSLRLIEEEDFNFDELTFALDLDHVNPLATRIVFALEIYDADKQYQVIGDLERTWLTFRTASTELGRIEYSNRRSEAMGLVIATLDRVAGTWMLFEAGVEHPAGIHAICRHYGVST